MKVYVASSWRNEQQQEIVALLREAGHEVYDFKNPRPGDQGFHWSEIDTRWREWTPAQFREALSHPIATAGFLSDQEGLRACECCVLVLPCGRSAHAEFGWAAGAGKRTVILLAEGEPELMYLFADAFALTPEELIGILSYMEASSRGCRDRT